MPAYLYEDGTLITFAPSPGARKPPGGRANGLKRKTFELTGKHKRIIRSASIRLFLKKKHGILFCTLTFPQNISQRHANTCFSNFVDNLRTNFKLVDYVAVKELTKVGRPHFHCLLDIPYTDYKILNKAWCSSFSGFMSGSPNAFTTGRNPVIRHIEQVAKYITKYITKTITGQTVEKPTTRQYFISAGTRCNPARIPGWLVDYLKRHHAHEIYEGDYFTWHRLYNWCKIPEDYLSEVDPPPKEKPKKPRRKAVKPDAKQGVMWENLDTKVDLHYKL